MITETTLAETIRITNPNPKYDNACKRMFSEKKPACPHNESLYCRI